MDPRDRSKLADALGQAADRARGVHGEDQARVARERAADVAGMVAGLGRAGMHGALGLRWRRRSGRSVAEAAMKKGSTAGEMGVELLGRASAAQVVAAYKFDFMVVSRGTKWPQAGDADEHRLPVLRLLALHDAGRWPGFILELVWDLYRISADELRDHVLSTWGLPMRRTAMEIAENRIPLGDEGQRRLDQFRSLVRSGDLPMGRLVAKNTDEAIHLVEGHHRVVAAVLEDKLPPTVEVFVGKPPPLKLGLAVHNGGGS